MVPPGERPKLGNSYLRNDREIHKFQTLNADNYKAEKLL
jgi:hypothetical protein